MHSCEFFNQLKAVRQTFVCNENKQEKSVGGEAEGKWKVSADAERKKYVIMVVQFHKPLSCDLIAAPFVSPPLLDFGCLRRSLPVAFLPRCICPLIPSRRFPAL